ncbi:MAG: hypothetical protein RL075_1798, partial [Pseudomonadota bacterium]
VKDMGRGLQKLWPFLMATCELRFNPYPLKNDEPI